MEFRVRGLSPGVLADTEGTLGSWAGAMIPSLWAFKRRVLTSAAKNTLRFLVRASDKLPYHCDRMFKSGLNLKP